MPPKSSNKKNNASATVSWYNCEKCDIHITCKEREKHEQKCPIIQGQLLTQKGEPLEYIRNNMLQTSGLEVLKHEIEQLNEMPMKYLNRLLLVSEGAMRLAGWRIGQNVIIKASDEDFVLIRSLWPMPEKFLTTIFVTEKDFLLNWNKMKGKVLQIQPMPKGQPKYAKSIILQVQSDKDKNNSDDMLTSQQLKDLKGLLKLELKDLIFSCNTLIHYNFFNKSLLLKIIDYSFDSAYLKSTTLETSLQNLSLQSSMEVFKIVSSTAVEVILDWDSSPSEADEDSPQFSISKEDIGGLTPELEKIEESIDYALGFKIIPKGVKISRGLLIYGSSGCGKTMICEAMCHKLQILQRTSKSVVKPLIIKLNPSELFSKFLGETEKNLSASFEKIYSHYPQPSLLLMEDVHNLCPKHENNEVVKRLTVAFLNILDALSCKKEAQKCFLLATTSQLESLNPSLRRCGRLDADVEIAAPTPEGREQILKCLLKKMAKHELTDEHVKQISLITHGFVGADLANLVSNAALKALKSDNELQMQHIEMALTTVKPSAMREVLIECPNVKWSDIGGQEELKLKLKQAVEWPLKHAEQFKRLGIKPPKGLLMFGPPGCSKTMIAKALATESQLNFLSIKGPELFSMWVGESERAVREVFRKARQVAPSIVFFDEIDAIGGERAEGSSGGSGSSVKERVLTQLLTELDGVETLKNVTIVAATNRPDMIDKALLRPGRIDRIVYVGLPDAAARHEIFRIKLQKMPLGNDVDIDKLVQLTEGYSGAEIQAVCHEAALKTLELSFEAEHVNWKQFEYALTAVQPRTNPELLRLYENYMKKS